MTEDELEQYFAEREEAERFKHLLADAIQLGPEVGEPPPPAPARRPPIPLSVALRR